MVKLSFVRQRHVAASLLMAGTFLVSACGGGGGAPSTPGATPTPISTATAVPAATPTPTPVPANDAAFVCPSSDTPASVASRASGEARLMPRRYAPASATQMRTVAVAYERYAVATQMATISSRERVLGASLVRSTAQTNGTTTRVLSVPASRATALVAALRTSTGVRSVALRGGRSYPMTVSGPYYTNDPYFTGFQVTAPPTPTATAPPATYEQLPYAESASVPGQWGDHAIQLEHAFEYSQSNNGSSVGNANALGSAGIKIAIIDTGEDKNHPELASKIVHEQCFITNPTSGVQSNSSFALDPDGHGTDVSGIAAAASNNGFGFVGSGGNAQIYAYRVDPTPDNSCITATGSNIPAQCGADTEDIASAIYDAIANHVNVISMSLGQSGGKCTNGVDPDSYEDAAVKAAIAANIIVVAASGNDSANNVTPPACDASVIAAGATALSDGQPTGGQNTSGTAANPVEYVASYSDYGTPGASFRNTSAWGIVAPGGDPVDQDADYLHWIENVWTTTPATSMYDGSCGTDYSGANGDCRILIAGTSMSTPLVAGAAALILGVNSSYQSPKAMKQLLCSTADEINDAKEGCGRLNVYRAMATALNDPQLP